MPADYAARKTAFLYNFDNRSDMENHKQNSRWDTMDHWLKYYRGLKSILAPVDVIPEEKDFSNYPFVVAPSYQLIDQALIGRLTRYVQDGGTLIMTCRSGQKDRRGQLWETLWAQPIYDLIGAAIPRYDVLPEGRNGTVSVSGKIYQWGTWGDLLEPRAGTETLAKYNDQFYKGTAAVTWHALGKGHVAYIGVDSIGGEFEADMLKQIYEKAGVKTATLPLDFMVDWRDGFWVATNFTDNDVNVPAATGTKMVIGTSLVPPGGVTIWK